MQDCAGSAAPLSTICCVIVSLATKIDGRSFVGNASWKRRSSSSSLEATFSIRTRTRFWEALYWAASSLSVSFCLATSECHTVTSTGCCALSSASSGHGGSASVVAVVVPLPVFELEQAAASRTSTARADKTRFRER